MTKKEKIEKAIDAYLELPKPNHAILINALWGKGKTHFLKNFINKNKKNNEKGQSTSFLKGLFNKNKESYEKKLPISYAYVSLYGVNSIASLQEKILLAKLGNHKMAKYGLMGIKLTPKIGSLLGELFSKDDTYSAVDGTIPIEEQASITKSWLKKDIWCFDDLERISPDINVSDVLGYINAHFVEHDNLHTIIIANEKEIRENKSKEENPIHTEYGKVKEKLIGRTIEFDLEIEDLLEDIIEQNKSLGRLKTDFKNLKAILIHYFEELECSNLRTVIFTLETLDNIFKYLNEKDIELYSKDIIHFTLALSIEYKETGKLEFKDESDYLGISFKEKTKRGEFKGKYKLGDNRDRWYESIYQYVSNGFLNVKDLEEEIKQRNDKQTKPEHIALRELSSYYEFDESKLKENLGKVFDFMNRSLYSFQDLLEIQRVVSELESEELYFWKKEEDVKTLIFNHLIESISHLGKDFFHVFRANSFLVPDRFKNFTTEQAGFIETRLEERKKELEDKMDRDLIKSLKTKVLEKEDEHSINSLLINYSDDVFDIIIEQLKESNDGYRYLSESFISCPSSVKNEFISSLKKINERIDGYIKDNKGVDGIARLRIKSLNDEIKKTMGKYSTA